MVQCVKQSNCRQSGSSCMESTTDLRCEKAYTGYFVTDEDRVQPCVKQVGCLTSCSDCVKARENRDLLICHHVLPGYWHDDDGVLHENECNVWPFPIGVVGKSYDAEPRLETEELDPCYGVDSVNGPTILKAVTDTECWLQCDVGYHPVYLHNDHYHWYYGDEGEDLSRPLTCGMIDGSEATTTLKCAKVKSDKHEDVAHSHGHGKRKVTKDGNGGKGSSHSHDDATHGESIQGSTTKRDGHAILDGSLVAAAISGFVAAVVVVAALAMLRHKHSENYDAEIVEELENHTRLLDALIA